MHYNSKYQKFITHIHTRFIQLFIYITPAFTLVTGFWAAPFSEDFKRFYSKSSYVKL